MQELPYVCKRAAIWALARYLTRKVIERSLRVRKVLIDTSASGDVTPTAPCTGYPCCTSMHPQCASMHFHFICCFGSDIRFFAALHGKARGTEPEPHPLKAERAVRHRTARRPSCVRSDLRQPMHMVAPARPLRRACC